MYVSTVGCGTKARHQCKLIGGDLSYGLLSAAKVSANAPCTNRPVKCLVCSTIVWSYSMEAHYAKRHPAVTMNPEVKEAVARKPHESDMTSQMLNNQKAKRPKCKDPQCVCSFK